MAILSSAPRQAIPNHQPRRSLSSDQLRRWLQPLVLLGLGLYFLYNELSGKIALYVNDAQFGWVPWVGAALFLSIGAAQLIDTLRAPADHDHADHDCIDCDHDHADHDHHHHDADEHDHDHSHAPSWLRLGLVAIPLIIGLIVPARPLGASAITTSGISAGVSSLGSLGGATGSFTSDPTKRNVLDWVRAFSTSSDVTEFTGQSADLIGFVYKDIRFDGKPQFMLARFAISCCVADASAIGVTVQTPDVATANKWQADTWVHITGKMAIDSSSGTPTPVLVADNIQPVAQPDQPYLYP